MSKIDSTFEWFRIRHCRLDENVIDASNGPLSDPSNSPAVSQAINQKLRLYDPLLQIAACQVRCKYRNSTPTLLACIISRNCELSPHFFKLATWFGDWSAAYRKHDGDGLSHSFKKNIARNDFISGLCAVNADAFGMLLRANRFVNC
jgi:hypothetical protein